jgi:superfamily II DNA or RNA helicase
MPRIFDNIEEQLDEALRNTLAASVTLDASVGYFNVRGWSALADAIDALPEGSPKVRLLIGMAERPDQELRQRLRVMGRDRPMDLQTADRLRSTVMQDLHSQLVWGLPTARDEATIRQLRRQLEEGDVSVRLHLRHSLHGKLYLCHRDDHDNPRTGYVGSSNLTFSGLVKQGELNVDVLDHDATEKLRKWFEDRWKDQFSVDVTDLLIELLDGSWASEIPLDPYLVYLKMAYHLSREARDGLLEYGLPESMASQLLDYQAVAVKVATRILLRRGGVMIGDVVGTGKTIVATAIARLMQEDHGTETLIVCPKNLVPMWEGYAAEYRLVGKVMSLSMVTKNLPDLRRHRVVVIDESHNLRTDTRQDYKALLDYIERNDSKVVLLTATPYNKDYLDVANQLGLFIGNDENLGIQPDRAIAAAGLDEFLRKCDGRPQTLGAFRKSEEAEDWRRLMSLFLVRRTRRFIRKNYAMQDDDGRDYLTFADGSRFYFPERVAKTVAHDIEEDDASAKMVDDTTLDTIDSLLLPRYSPWDYINHGLAPEDAEKPVLDDLERASGNLIGVTRTMFYKRLSSCPASYLLSLRRHLIRNRIALDALRRGLALPIGHYGDASLIDEDPDYGLPDGVYPPADDIEAWENAAGSAYDALVRKRSKAVRWLRAGFFSEQFADDLRTDIEAIQGLLIRYGEWRQKDDTKLDALEELIRATHGDEKVLVFTEYRDTAEYVAESLEARGITSIASVSGSSNDPTVLARKFSPISNKTIGGLPRGQDEIRVLVATDVLSEGQNLQDGHVVVNFDLPWAIIKIIQRAGRVDRIGQQSPEVLLYSFLPAEDINKVIRLRQRIRKRLEENAVVFGSDEAFFGDDGEKKIIEDLYSGKAALDDWEGDGEDVDWASMAFEIWRAATEGNPTLAARVEGLPDVVYSTMSCTEGQEDGVIVHAQTGLGFDALAFTNTEGESVMLSPYEALKMAACTSEEPALERLYEHHELVAQAVAGPLQAPAVLLEGALTGVRKRCWDRLSSYKDKYLDTLFDSDRLDAALDALYRRPLREAATQMLANALRERTPDELGDLIVMLHEEDRLCVGASDLEEDDLRIVCSLGLKSER